MPYEKQLFFKLHFIFNFGFNLEKNYGGKKERGHQYKLNEAKLKNMDTVKKLYAKPGIDPGNLTRNMKKVFNVILVS